MKVTRYNIVPYTLFAGFIAIGVITVIALFLCAVNDAMATKTVLETWPGTKSVCTRQEWNYSLKVTQCKAYANVPATCKKTETAGPIFDAYMYTECN
jgi:hypothetical protein